jgi:hypothetical protein
MRFPFLFVVVGCSSHTVEERPLVAFPTDGFVDVSEASGIQVGNFDPDPPPGMAINDHSRLAFADLNGDRIDDVVMHSLFPNALAGIPFTHRVFLGNGDGTFTDHTDASGLGDVQAAFFAFGDLDNDGDQDLFAGMDIPTLGSNSVWLNDGSGRFTEVERSGVLQGDAMAANAVLFDADGDAVLDLFVGYGGTTGAAPDRFFRGNGDGTFTRDVAALPDAPSQPSNGTVACDFDDDGDLDVFVSTYGVSTNRGVNHLWLNDGTGNFTEQAATYGFAALATGNPWLSTTGEGTEPQPDAGPDGWIGSNGFGIDCADMTGDGFLDIVLATISHPVDSDPGRKWSDGSQLLVNQGPAGDFRFEDEWAAMGLPFNEGDVDIAAVDIDFDGQRDLSLSRVSTYTDAYDSAAQQDWFGLMFQGRGTFDGRTFRPGVNALGTRVMRGAQNHAWADVDLDGDLDLLVGGRTNGSAGRANRLFENTAGQDNRHLVVHLEGDGVNVDRDAIGTRLRLENDLRPRVAEHKSSRGMYNSEDTAAIHLALHDYGANSRLEVRWLDGTVHRFLAGEDFGDDEHVVIRYPDQIETLDR